MFPINKVRLVEDRSEFRVRCDVRHRVGKIVPIGVLEFERGVRECDGSAVALRVFETSG